jgi:hypothetical protein
MVRRIFQNTLKVLSVALSLAIAFAYTLMNVRSYFAWYDDEGFMLMTLRQYTTGLPLYDKMYTEYGPFYYVFHSALFRFAGWTVTHDHIRWITIFLCVAIAAVWAACVWMWSRSIFWTTTALLATAVVLRLLNREPGHPQTLVLLFYGVAFMAASAYRKFPSPWIFAIIGAASASLALTKINVGVFMCAALAVVVTSCLPADAISRTAAVFVRLCCIALPAVLMYRHFMTPSAVIQCLIYTFGIFATLHIVKRNARPELTWSAVFWTVAGFSAVILGTVIAIVLHGTSLQGVLNGILLVPLRFSQGIAFQSISQTPTLIAALAVASTLFYARSSLKPRQFSKLQAAVAGIVIVLTVISPPMGAAMAPAVVFIFLPRPGGAFWESRFRLSLSFVGVAACMSVLMAYPVTGSQLSVAATIVLLSAFGALLQGIGPFVRNIAPPEIRLPYWERAVCALMLIVVIGIGARTLAARPTVVRSDRHLPNAQLIELSNEDYEVLSELTMLVSSHCETLVTIPGMNSFHIWSGLPHPNGFIVSATMVLFDDSAQDRLKKDFLASRRPCVIFNPELMVWGAAFRPSRPSQPFIDLVKNELVQVYSRRGYEIRVPGEQSVDWRR